MVLTVSAFVLRGHPFLEKLARGRHFAASTFLTLWMLVHRLQFQHGQRTNSVTSLVRLGLLTSQSDGHFSICDNRRTASGNRWITVSATPFFSQTDSFVLLKLRGFGFINRAEEVRGSGWTLSYLSHFSGNSCSLHTALDSWKDTVTELIRCI